MKLDPRVREFLEESATPEEHLTTYLDDDALHGLFPARKRRVPRYPEDLVKQWAAAFLALIDVPPQLKGARRAWRVLRYLVPYYLKKTTPPIPRLPYRVLAALLRRVDVYPDTKLMVKRVSQERAQLFTLHLQAFSRNRQDFSRTKQARQPLAAYALWMPCLHEGLREIQRSTPKASTIKWYMTSVRMFFRYFPHHALRGPIPTPTHALLQYHLKESFEQYRRKFRKRQDKSDTPEDHKANIIRLVVHHHQVRQRDTRQSIETRRQPHGESIRERVPFEEFPRYLQVKIHQIDAPTISEVECVVELDHEDDVDKLSDPDVRVTERVYITRSSERVVPRPPGRQRDRLNPYLLAAFPWWWDCRASVNLYDLGTLYTYIYGLIAVDVTRHAGVALFALFALFTGRTLRDLGRLQFHSYPDRQDSEEPPRDGFFFDPDRHWFFYFQARGRSSFVGDPKQGWLSSTPWVAFPAPEVLRFLLEPYLDMLRESGAIIPGNFVLNHVTKDGDLTPLALIRFDAMARADYAAAAEAGFLTPVPLTRLSESDLDTILAKTNIEPPDSGSFLTPPPIVHLARAFPALIGHGGGLDDVAVRLISGRGTLRAYPQIHYTRLIPHTMFSAYQEACAALHAKIVEGLPAPVRKWWCTRAASRRLSLPAEGFGSPLVCQGEAIRRGVAHLLQVITRTRRVRSLADVVTHHNAYTCYAYLLLLHLGIRPQRSPTVGSEDEAATWERLVIADKKGAMYREQRLLLLPSPGPAILTQLSQGRDRLRRALWAYAGTAPVRQIDATRDGQPSPLLLLLNSSGELIPFSLTAFREQLRWLKIHLPDTTPPNWGRHWIRTHLYTDGFADDAIDLWLGHVRAGREPLASHSSARYGAALQEVSNRVGHHLAAVGFRPVQYFPGG